MGLAIIERGYGAPAQDELIALVRAHQGADPLRPVTVVVPSNTVGVALRRQLARSPGAPGRHAGIGAVAVLTGHRLAELLASTHLGAGRRPVTTPVLGAAVRSVLAEKPGAFAGVADHPATAEALVAAHRRLTDLWAGAQGEQPAAIAALATGSRQLTREVVRVHLATRARLVAQWYDEADLTDAAIRAVNGGSSIVADLGLVVVHLPQEVVPGQSELLAALSGQLEVVVLAGITGEPTADAPVRRSLDRLSVAAGGDPVPPVAPDASAAALGTVTCTAMDTLVFTASDADDEVRMAVRHVGAAVRDGTPLERIAVLYGSDLPYSRLVHEHLNAAGFAFNGAASRPLRERLLARSILALLDLQDDGFRLGSVLGLVGSAPVLDREGRTVPAARWERYARSANIVSGADWDLRLGLHAEDLRGRARISRPDEPETSSKWRAAERVDALRTFVLDLQNDLAADPGGWSERVAWVHRLIRRYFGSDALRQKRWRASEAAAAEKVEAALERLADLDGIEPDPPLSSFRSALELELDADLGRTGKLGNGVLVGPVGSALGLDLDLVVIVGLVEGTYPSTAREDALLPNDEVVAAGAPLPSAMDRLHRQHRQLLAVLAASRRRVLGAPRGDLRKTAERVPSRWLLDVAGALAGTPTRMGSDQFAALPRASWFEPSSSFAAGVEALAITESDTPAVASAPAPSGQLRFDLAAPAVPPPLPAVTEQEVRLHGLPGRGEGHHLPVAVADPVVAGGLRLVRARDGAAFTEFDGNLHGLAVPMPSAGSVVSPTGLEQWVGCPFRYFVQRILGVREREEPEDVLELGPMERGSLIHLALEKFVTAVLESAEHPPPAPHEPWSAGHEGLLHDSFDAACREYAEQGAVGPELLWARERQRTRHQLEQFLDHDARRRLETGSSPVAVELGFGFDDEEGGIGVVPVELPDGRTVNFRGSIDRIDQRPDGTLLVVDYKTGGRTTFKDITQDTPTAGGSKLQLPIYALAARKWAEAAGSGGKEPVRSTYWFISHKEGFEEIGIDVDDLVLDLFAEVVGAIDTGIGEGLFPARPKETWGYVECPYCDPDGLGTADLRRSWERKKHDPVLRPYLELVEPPEDDDA